MAETRRLITCSASDIYCSLHSSFVYLHDSPWCIEPSNHILRVFGRRWCYVTLQRKESIGG